MANLVRGAAAAVSRKPSVEAHQPPPKKARGTYGSRSDYVTKDLCRLLSRRQKNFDQIKEQVNSLSDKQHDINASNTSGHNPIGIAVGRNFPDKLGVRYGYRCSRRVPIHRR